MKRCGLLILFNCIAFSSFAEDIWLLVDTESLVLEVKKGEKTVETFKNIAIGRSGAGHKRRAGDDTTPIGTYKIGWINLKSPYKRFYGFNYPSEEDASVALNNGVISRQIYDTIVSSHRRDQIPPQNTPLGGRIGIHGLGAGDERIHGIVNWTHGCVALTNEQLRRLDKWVSEGTVVKIK
ncbi:MAG: L,D-transpeptidase family protein [Gammaproteobacteria bacterium]